MVHWFSLQTGSGKTYTMGTGFEMALATEEVGVIPRAVNQIFTGIEERRREAIEKNEPPPQYELTAQFLEVQYPCMYNVHVCTCMHTPIQGFI